MTRWFLAFVVPLVLVALPAAAAAPKTVCTITVNSADEKDTMRARLPQGQYRFVELVEKGRPDWLRSACRKKVQCDVLVVSGHFNAGDDFYSDQLENNEYLRVDELERAACSDSCPGLFAQLKEVYLFGCESLKPVGDGDGGESSRERMKRVFSGVPLIYGFSSAAPVGPTAAMLLNRHFDRGAKAIGTGRADARLLGIFQRNSMTYTAGLQGEEAARQRRQVCTYYDERLEAAQKLARIHALMRRDIQEARRDFPRIEKLMLSLDEGARESSAFAQALAELSADDATRERFLALARQGKPAMRARMLAVAATWGWLTPEALRQEHVALASELLSRPTLAFGEVDLVCTLGKEAALREALPELKSVAASASPRAPHAAALACAGDVESQGRVVRALASREMGDVQMAQLYLRHRPLTEPAMLRQAARDVARMPPSSAKVRAIDALGRQRIADREILEELARSFSESRSVEVQRAIAEVFIRSERSAFSAPAMAATLRAHRLRAPDGREDLIDVLIRRLEAS